LTRPSLAGFGCPLTLKILYTARKKRVDIIHGKKDSEIEIEELTKMRTIIEKMLVKKITYLKY